MNKNLIQQNPNLSGSLFLSIISTVLMLLAVPLFALIALAISSRQIYKAKKANENKKFIIVGYIFIAIPLILWAINIAFFVISNLRGTGTL
jgi:ABC-type multidrug transport system permease subunit